MIAKKLLVSLNLTRTQAFYVYEVAKVNLIDKDNDFVLATF